jgi:hypothetical protein
MSDDSSADVTSTTSTGPVDIDNIDNIQHRGPPNLSRRLFTSQPDSQDTTTILPRKFGCPGATVPHPAESLGLPPNLSRSRLLENRDLFDEAPVGLNMTFSKPDLSRGQCEATANDSQLAPATLTFLQIPMPSHRLGISTQRSLVTFLNSAMPHTDLVIIIASDHPVHAEAPAVPRPAATETPATLGAATIPVQVSSAPTVRKYWRDPDYPRLVDNVPFPPPSVCRFP